MVADPYHTVAHRAIRAQAEARLTSARHTNLGGDFAVFHVVRDVL
jgi:hypothetical protein